MSENFVVNPGRECVACESEFDVETSGGVQKRRLSGIHALEHLTRVAFVPEVDRVFVVLEHLGKRKLNVVQLTYILIFL